MDEIVLMTLKAIRKTSVISRVAQTARPVGDWQKFRRHLEELERQGLIKIKGEKKGSSFREAVYLTPEGSGVLFTCLEAEIKSKGIVNTNKQLNI